MQEIAVPGHERAKQILATDLPGPHRQEAFQVFAQSSNGHTEYTPLSL